MGRRGFGNGGDEDVELGREPIEVAQGYVDERATGLGWRVEELAGDVNFGMVTVLLGRYEDGDEVPVQVETAEGHGQSIQDAVDDAFGRTAEVDDGTMRS